MLMFLTPDEADGACIEFNDAPPRYTAVFQPSWVAAGDRMLYEGDDEAVAKQWARAAEIARTIIFEILRWPALLVARSFSELHNHCDANMLGAQPAFLIECGWTGQDDVKDGAALAASTDVLDLAQQIVGVWLETRRA